jgi:hypothetical protein
VASAAAAEPAATPTTAATSVARPVVWAGQEFVLDKAADGKVDEGTLCVSPDGKHVAYAAVNKDGHVIMFVDGKPCKDDAWTGGGRPAAVFSPDAARTAYVAAHGGKRVAVVDRQEGPEFDEISGLQFSPDSKRAAYVGRRDNRKVIVVDGAETPEYEQCWFLSFSPDSSRWMGWVGTPWKLMVCLDGQAITEYPDTLSATFSPDSRRVAFGANVKNGTVAVVDGNPGKVYANVIMPGFSPDSRRVAFQAEIEGKAAVVIDGTEGRPYAKIWDYVTFSPDSRRTAYWTGSAAACVPVIDGVEGKTYQMDIRKMADGATMTSVPAMIFSADSAHIAMCASRGGKKFLVIDAAEKELVGMAGRGFFNISRDLSHVAYEMERDGKRLVVFDEAEWPACDEILAGELSPDGRHLACLVRRDGKVRCIVDGQEVAQAYDRLVPGIGLVWKGKQDLWFVAIRGQEILRVEVGAWAPGAVPPPRSE